MLKVYAYASTSRGYYDDVCIDRIEAKIEVTCSSCNRLVYLKEIDADDNYYGR